MDPTPPLRLVTEPVAPALARSLRQAVLAHGRSERRRTYPATLRVGFPRAGSRQLSIPAHGRWDHSLRTEAVRSMASRFLDEGAVPLVWLTRAHAGAQADDLRWAAAAEAAAAEAAVTLTFVVVTPRSWIDPRSGVGRTWRRAIRVRGGASPAA